MANRNRSAEKEAGWRELISAQAASGLSVRQFCLQREVSEASFYAWRRVILQRDAESAAASDLKPKLVPVTVAPVDASFSTFTATPSSALLELITPQGWTLRFAAETPPETIAALVSVIVPAAERRMAC